MYTTARTMTSIHVVTEFFSGSFSLHSIQNGNRHIKDTLESNISPLLLNECWRFLWVSRTCSNNSTHSTDPCLGVTRNVQLFFLELLILGKTYHPNRSTGASLLCLRGDLDREVGAKTLFRSTSRASVCTRKCYTRVQCRAQKSYFALKLPLADTVTKKMKHPYSGTTVDQSSTDYLGIWTWNQGLIRLTWIMRIVP